MFSHVITAAISGMESKKVVVEADVSDGLPMFSMVGFLASEVREANDRVRTAMKNSGIHVPACRITVNMSPADMRKSGSGFDLPIAVAVTASLGHIHQKQLEGIFFAGELSLDGSINPIRGIMSMLLEAQRGGCHTCVIPYRNLAEGCMFEKLNVYGAQSLSQVIGFLNGDEKLATMKSDMQEIRKRQKIRYEYDFAELKGQENVRRAAVIAVAGFHNMLIIGPPGSGKTMTAKRIPSILPEMTMEEIFEVSRIQSIAGILPAEDGIMTVRPFRSPHHTATSAALIGGGMIPQPGEVSLAHRGILFLDELPEFREETIENLREPMEDGRVRIARVQATYEYPADFMLVASMNPCRCGYYPDRSRCRCSARDVRRYLNHISQPLLDRIDMCVEAQETAYEDLAGKADGESSKSLREKVEIAREIQMRRYQGTQFRTNADLTFAAAKEFCILDAESEKRMEQAFHKLQLTGRSYLRILKVARTIADLEKSDHIGCVHLSEAISLRSLDRKYWGNML